MILGYGVAGPDEPRLEQTLKEFKRLCDRVIIVSNNSNQKELIRSYGFEIHEDNREWGRFQHRIKEDFVKRYIPLIKPTGCLCLDMDEVLDPRVSKQYLEELPGYGAYFHFVNLWDDEAHYNPNLSFWNVRYWKYDPSLPLEFEQKPLHCWLVPKIYTTLAHRVPFIVRHYGLINREKKIARYEKYDPKGQYKGIGYYEELKVGKGIPYKEDEVMAEVEEFVKKYRERVKTISPPSSQKFFYVQNPQGQILDIPERDLARTVKRPGFTLIAEIGAVYQVAKEAPVVEKNPLECFCGFVAKSEFGLKAHSKKHK